MRQRRRNAGQTSSASTSPSCSARRCTVTSPDWHLNTMSKPGWTSHSPMTSLRSARSPSGGRPKTGRTGPMQRGEVWFAATPGGNRPVLVLTRDPVAAITRTVRGLVSELELTATDDGVPTDCVVNFDNIHTVPRDAFRRHVVKLEPPRLAQACQRLRDATGC